ncbi:hypothetical protein OIU34_19660 [Pararhizobium sp. BT-229]|uniref:hypothetical protein n=1 Tax=Pararhizobium sp. BT-229 TaxID=2986923 RepID=UPI0021F7F69B|nr:hypothetical protein [Pararhizobium sp. BT-229]MCV9964102.1 hypothetical protein [Pararhizobium sp. BT-229]
MSENFPDPLRWLATKCHTLPATQSGMHDVDLEAVLQGPFRTVSERYPHRKGLLGLLADVSLGKRVGPAEQRILNQETDGVAYAPSSAAEEILSDAERCHGHVATITIRIVDVAFKSGLLGREVFLATRRYDSGFFKLLNSFGRDAQPRETFAAYAVYEAERQLGSPIRDIAPFRAILVP